ncbi:kinase-like protein [Whalleya microplaca]|nr:kinase-like protein [Whalleya microplaca]
MHLPMESQRLSSRSVSREELNNLLTKTFGSSYSIEESAEEYLVTLPRDPAEDTSVPLKDILKRLRKDNVDKRSYIPLHLFYSKTSKRAIRHSLDQNDIPKVHRDEVADRIFKHGRKILAILILIDKVKFVLKFIEQAQLQDQKLPLKTKDLCEILGDEDIAKDFYQKQWELLAPEFCLGTLTDPVPGRVALPFLEDKWIGKGHFANVYEIQVDQEHVGKGKGFSGRLVRKELNQVDHKFEHQNLAILNHLKHPNILELLTSYVYIENENKKKYNLVFPLADGGTLEKLFQEERQTTRFTTDESILIALAGLSSAIEHIHNFTDRKLDLALIGCHHDFRPRNVLISGRTLVLADFGLSHFKDATTTSETPFRPAGDDYDPPESGNLAGEQTTMVRRSGEVWSFGCLLAETATWMESGPKGIEEFENQRKFAVTTAGTSIYSYFHRGSGKPNIKVHDWLDELLIKKPESIKQLIQLIRDMLSVLENERPKSYTVTLRLRIISLLKIAEDIEGLFERLLKRDEVSDILLEFTRFQAWAHIIGDIKGPSRTTETSNSLASQNFQSTLQHLFALREHLNSMLSTTSTRWYAGCRILIHFVDNLIDGLDGDQQESLRIQFMNLLLSSDDQTLQDQLQRTTEGGPYDKAIRMRIALTHATQLFNDHQSTGVEDRRIESKSIKTEKDFGQHKLGSIRTNQGMEPVLVEWRKYGRDDSSRSIIQELLLRVKRLTDILSLEKPDEFCSLPCRGFFHNESLRSFGVVYGFPSSVKNQTKPAKPTTLQKLIYKTLKSKCEQPRLEDKFQLAITLATAILEFHIIGWLHKNLSSESVVFFPTKGLSAGTIKEPYIIGLNHSRPNDPLAFTEGIPDLTKEYQHPQYRIDQRRYRPEYDYYSLGLVLLEIGLWETLESMKRNSWDQLSAKELSKDILASRVPLLMQHMGTPYHDAVVACMSGQGGLDSSFGEEQQDPKTLHSNFEKCVIRRLREWRGPQ